jgi:hypothetical protein
MNITDFARIRNAKALLLTPEKRVLHFPKTNKVRIDNIGSDVPEYRQADIRSSRKEYANADTASKLGVVPAVQNYRERGNLQTYTQDYAGKSLPEQLEGVSAKEQYKLGSQVGRIQNKLLSKGLGHTDLHEGNIVRLSPKRKKVQLIDNDAIKNIKSDYDKKMMQSYYMPQAFNTGYNSRINFTQHTQMQHFANFGFTNPLPAIVDKARPYWHNVQDAGSAAKGVGQAFAQNRGVQIGAGIGAAAGLVKGSGVGESEEEKARTTGLGRLGKLVGNAGVGGIVGGGLGFTGGVAKEGLKDAYANAKYYRRNNIDD